MTTISGAINLATANGADVSGLTRVGPTTRVFLDGTATVTEPTNVPAGNSLLGDNAVLITQQPLGSGTSAGGDYNFTNSAMWIDFQGGPMDIGGSGNTFSWQEGTINFVSTGTDQVNGGPFLRARGGNSTNFNLTGTTFNSYLPPAPPMGLNAASPGLNLAGVNLAGSSLNRVVFNGIWTNIPADFSLIGVDFSNSIFRPNQFYHIRFNPAVDATTRGTFIIGANLNNFGTLAGGGNAGLQLFGDINSLATNYRGVYVIDCELRPAGGLVVNSFTPPADGTLVATLQAWRPSLQNAGVAVADARLKYDTTGSTLYNAPAQVDFQFDITAAETANRQLIQERGYYRLDQTTTISSSNTSATLDYTDLSNDNRYVFATYTDLISNGQYTYPSTRAGVNTTTGLPDALDVKNTITDVFLQGVAIGSVPANSAAQSNPNGSYQQLKRNIYNSNAGIDWSNVVSNYNGSVLTFDGSINLVTTSNSTYDMASNDPTSFNFRVPTTGYGVSTATGAITGLVTTTTMELSRVPITGLTLSAATISNPRVFTTRPEDPSADNSFDGCTLTGDIVVNPGSANSFVVFNDCTRSGTLSISRGTGTGTVFVVGAPAGTTLNTGVEAAPPQFLFTAVPPVGATAPDLTYGIFLYTYVAGTSFTYRGEANNARILGDGNSLSISEGERVAAVYTGAYWEPQLRVFDPVTADGITHAQELLLDRSISQLDLSTTMPMAQLIRDTISPTQTGPARLSSGTSPVFLQFANSSTSPGTPADINRIVGATRGDFTVPTGAVAGDSSARLFADLVMAAFIDGDVSAYNFPDQVSTQINTNYVTLDTFEVNAAGGSVTQQINGIFFRGTSGAQARAIAGAALNSSGATTTISSATAVPQFPANDTGTRTEGEQLFVSAVSYSFPMVTVNFPTFFTNANDSLTWSLTVGTTTVTSTAPITFAAGQSETQVLTSVMQSLQASTLASQISVTAQGPNLTIRSLSRAMGSTLTFTFTTYNVANQAFVPMTVSPQETFPIGTYSFRMEGSDGQWDLISGSPNSGPFLLNVTPSVNTDYDANVTAPVLADLLSQANESTIQTINTNTDEEATVIRNTIWASKYS